MAFLFDTDAISEVLRGRPRPDYIQWLRGVPREDQFTSAVVAAELYRGALGSERARFHLENIEKRVLPGVTVLPFDVAVARVYGEIEAGLKSGHSLADADLQIAATAIRHGLELVTRNVRHFETVPGLVLCRVLGEAQPAEAQPVEAQLVEAQPAETAPRDIHAAMAAIEMYRWQPEED
ncbi:MAG TPA: PIN domain-containing protein [Thermoanaerobaculia bacterium]|jgi:predicted nucleic acid-binding protein